MLIYHVQTPFFADFCLERTVSLMFFRDSLKMFKGFN